MSTTVDAICRGLLALEQPSAGYRFNLDAIVLARFIQQRWPVPAAAVVDLGAGCGVVGLLVARLWPSASVALVELDAELAALAAANVRRNDLGARVRAYAADLRTWASWPPDALAVSNPPFYPESGGRRSPVGQIAAARHEITCTLDALVAAAAPSSRIALVHLADRREEIVERLSDHGWSSIVVRAVRPLPDRPPRRVLVAASRDATPPAASDDDLVVECAPGAYSEELEWMLSASTL